MARCIQCGTENPSGKFCAHCGSPLPQQAQAGGPGWVKWAIGGGIAAVVLVGAVVLAVQFGGGGQADPVGPGGNTPSPGPAPAPGPAPKPAPDPAPPKNNTGGAQVKLAAKGVLGFKGSFYTAAGQYLAGATGERAVFYKFDASGAVQKLATIEDKNAGALLDVGAGDMLNAGVPVMTVVYQQKIYVVPPNGQAQVLPHAGVKKVLIGDYDGDGKNETIFLKENSFEVYRYVQGGDIRPIYGKKDIATPLPVLVQTPQKAGNRNVLWGYTREGGALSLILYKWDGIGGPVVIGQYPVAETSAAPAQWAVSGPTAVGPAFAIARGGAKPTVEVLVISGDAKSLSSLGAMTPDGLGEPVVMISPFMGGNAQILTVDDAGNYFIYDINPK